MNDVKERFKFNTVGLFTRDNKATVDFYTKAFGFTTDWDDIQPRDSAPAMWPTLMGIS